MDNYATLLAGVPSENPALYHRVRFGVSDPAAWLQINTAAGSHTQFIVRDIELDRARRRVRVDQVRCPADYRPSQGLSGDRTTATAQAATECLMQHQVKRVITDRTLPFVFAWHLMQAGIDLEYAADLGVRDRRIKDEQEIQWLSEAQRVTEQAVGLACCTVARATADSDGYLNHAGQLLTCELLQKLIAEFLLDRQYQSLHGMIVATTPQTGDCHERGTGAIKTGEAVIIDVYPRSMKTRYYGDCTRTVVHGQPNEMMRRMHAGVIAAKHAAFESAVAGATADQVHAATKSTLTQHGFQFARGQISEQPVMPHGTGHGLGLEVHEPILLDDDGGTLLAGEALTIEPGLYSPKYGGVRVEDLIIVSPHGPPRNLNQLPEGLDWSSVDFPTC